MLASSLIDPPPPSLLWKWGLDPTYSYIFQSNLCDDLPSYYPKGGWTNQFAHLICGATTGAVTSPTTSTTTVLRAELTIVTLHPILSTFLLMYSIPTTNVH